VFRTFGTSLYLKEWGGGAVALFSDSLANACRLAFSLFIGSRRGVERPVRLMTALKCGRAVYCRRNVIRGLEPLAKRETLSPHISCLLPGAARIPAAVALRGARRIVTAEDKIVICLISPCIYRNASRLNLSITEPGLNPYHPLTHAGIMLSVCSLPSSSGMV
jgi:hypothetical protein